MPRTCLMAMPATVATALLLSATSIQAQEMDYLSLHLQHQQSVRVQDHQNAMRAPLPNERRDRGERPARSSSTDPNCSAEALPADERQAMESRFMEIDRNQGRAAAMAYVQEQGRQFRQRLVEEGVCS